MVPEFSVSGPFEERSVVLAPLGPAAHRIVAVLLPPAAGSLTTVPICGRLPGTKLSVPPWTVVPPL